MVTYSACNTSPLHPPSPHSHPTFPLTQSLPLTYLPISLFTHSLSSLLYLLSRLLPHPPSPHPTSLNPPYVPLLAQPHFIRLRSHSPHSFTLPPHPPTPASHSLPTSLVTSFFSPSLDSQTLPLFTLPPLFLQLLTHLPPISCLPQLPFALPHLSYPPPP